ncbi:hypothetical protein KQ51_00041 [Candidatus Izimaplasma bacterium HR1]|jgi:hypothetical protein|uniref:hypothetical protein n=1 Tax=Candidatus Izimoplasma sp. HR1 TaxID=1541959 RepID=UPI0004F60DA4|nr:hypothetical protein KQ51_00041 [Candidatus Izimaplasma bacterium HR1]
MKKLIMIVVLMLGSLVLSGCDVFDTGINNVWYDETTSTIHISYRIVEEKEDEETGETPFESLHLLGKTKDSEWFEITELTSFTKNEQEIPYETDVYGDLELKIVKKSADGSITHTTDIYNLYINEPQFIYHFDVQFDSWSGVVNFNFGVNAQLVKNIIIYKSTDGGNNWVEVLSSEIVIDDEQFYKSNFEYYEYEEDNYVYKLVALDEDSTVLNEQSSWGEINVYYENKNNDGEARIDYVVCNYDVYSSNVNIWWNSFGDFDTVLIEKSTDNTVWELVDTLPRFVQSYNYQEVNDGEYYYRVSAEKDDVVLSSNVSENTLRVNENALIGYLDAWLNWDTQNIQINWDFQSEDVFEVVIKRKTQESEYELLGSFGALKKTHTDEDLVPGNYQYKVVLLDKDGNELDSLETSEINVEQPQHVYHLNAWFNQSTGEVHFNFGLNQHQVSYYTIEKSDDGGLSWEVIIIEDVQNEDDWYKDNFVAYELTEGVYAYRITGYNNENENLGEAYNYGEVIVDYTNLNFDEPTEFFHFGGNFNIYDQTVNLWWNSQGNYTEHVIEVTVDGVNYEEVLRVPRVVTFVSIDSVEDGEYMFRISAVDENNIVVDSITIENAISVRENAQIGAVHFWWDCTYDQLQISWEIIKDDVATIKVYRTNTTINSTVLVGEYGPLKTTLLDTITDTGITYYTIVLIDSEGNIIDQLDSDSYEIYTCE